MQLHPFTFIIVLHGVFGFISGQTEDLESGKISTCFNDVCEEKANSRYFLYDVNPGEGFNLRRDIYIRVAPLIQRLNQLDASNKWILVLPPWGRLPHWRNQKDYFPWSTYFQIDVIRDYIPVLEFEEYLDEYGLDNKLDIVFQLQHFQFDPEDRVWTEKIEVGVRCEDDFPYAWNATGRYFSRKLWNHKIIARNATCVALRGQASTLSTFLINLPYKAVLFDRAEVILWDTYGGPEWWRARKSLQFSQDLLNRAESYLMKTVPSFQLAKILTNPQFLGVHLRRQDFILGRRNVPSLQGAVFQWIQLVKRLKLGFIFLASDASPDDFHEIRKDVAFLSDDQELGIQLLSFSMHPDSHDLFEGEIAAIDQIICSWAAFFIGTPDSTFTLRIFEEREIVGFDSDLTFNYLCPDPSEEEEVTVECKQPTKWKITR